MATRTEILLGADFSGFEDYCVEVANAIKNHYRISDPCTNMTHRQPGEILSDPDDDKIYHVGGASGYPCDEILQETRSADKTPEFISIDLGYRNITTTCKALAFLSADQLNINDITWTKILLDSVGAPGYNPGGYFDTGNNKYVAPATGYYLIVGNVLWVPASTIADKSYYTGIYVNGSLRSANCGQAAAIGAAGACVSTVALVTAGQDIELYCYHNAGANTPDVDGGTVWNTFLAVHLLSID
jgi:hypothetical protein